MPGIRKLYRNSSGGLSVLNDTTATISAALLTQGTVIAEYNNTQTPTIGATMAVYGANVTATPDSGYYSIEPSQLVITWGGTFNSETATLNITATYNDGTTANQTSTATATGTTTLSTGALSTLLTTVKQIVSLKFQTKSTISSSAVTTSIAITGTESQ